MWREERIVQKTETFRTYMNAYKLIAEDTLYGGDVETFTKTSAGVIQQANTRRIEELINQGVGFIGTSDTHRPIPSNST